MVWVLPPANPHDPQRKNHRPAPTSIKSVSSPIFQTRRVFRLVFDSCELAGGKIRTTLSMQKSNQGRFSFCPTLIRSPSKLLADRRAEMLVLLRRAMEVRVSPLFTVTVRPLPPVLAAPE